MADTGGLSLSAARWIYVSSLSEARPRGLSKEELAEYFQEVLADYRDYPHDPGHDQRIAIENFRRKSYKEARDTARKAI